MISEDKIIEIFFFIDEFCKEFEKELSKINNLTSDGVRRRNRKASMSHSEILTVLHSATSSTTTCITSKSIWHLSFQMRCPTTALLSWRSVCSST